MCFNPRPHMGGDRSRRGPCKVGKCFNPRPHMGGDGSYTSLPMPYFLFQSTPPHGGRLVLFLLSSEPHISFNPRPHMGGDRFSAYCTSRDIGFNPRPHMGGDSGKRKKVLSAEEFQSTPPHGGRLDKGHDWRHPGVCFNPRPHMGGDLHTDRLRRDRSRFNPRPHMGGDQDKTKLMLLHNVSIHAPTWGATHKTIYHSLIHSFNPRPHMGGDRLSVMRWTENHWFQSTPPHGGRRHSRHLNHHQLMFQSTPPHGGRPKTTSSPWGMARFQSTPPHGGRPGGAAGT